MIRFGDCRLDVEARRIFRGTREVHLPPKAFELLKLLLENRPKALSKQELLDRVWPDVFVSDASLARVVNQIREGVGDDARRPRIVRTVHGYGYAFEGDVVNEPRQRPDGRPHQAVCSFVVRRQRYPLPDGEHLVGRAPDAAVWLDSPKVSRHHARVVVDGRHANIEDLGSKNGTFVRGQRIDAATPLQPGDRIRIGLFTIVFQVARVTATTETTSVTRQDRPRGPARERGSGSS